MAEKNFDPWGNYYFSLELDKVEVAHFMECSGIKTTAEQFEIEEGGFNSHVHKRSGRSKWDNIILKQATSFSTKLLEWRDDYLTDKWADRPSTTGAVVMRDNSGKELRRFTFTAAWPVSWEGPTLNSGSSDLGIETLEIAHEGIILGDVPPAPPEVKTEPVKNFAPDRIQFELDSAELTPEGEKTVNEISKSIEESDSKVFWVEGHTCDLGPGGAGSAKSSAYNKDLSKKRAKTVADALQKKHKDASFTVSGFGFDHPVKPNVNEYARSANRRTDVMNAPPPEGRGWLK